MIASILDGRACADNLLAEVRKSTEEFQRNTKIIPSLAVVLVGDNPASQVYVRSKTRAAQSVGFHAVTHKLQASANQQDLEELIMALNADRNVHGILIQLPLPKHLDEKGLIDLLDPLKDVDGLHHANAGLLAIGRPRFVPCTPQGCMMLIKQARPALRGLKATVLGRSILVGRPLSLLLLDADCTVTIAHSGTADIASVCADADILVAAVGKPGLVRGDWIKQGATVIDVGINRIAPLDNNAVAKNPVASKGNLVGDVAFAEAAERAGHITPVPGGVGPMTVACLLKNTLQAAIIQSKR